MEKIKFEKSWNYKNEEIQDIYTQNAWNQTLISLLNQIKGSLLNNNDVILVSYVLKDLMETLLWMKSTKPIIKYRFDNQHSIFFNGGRIRIENYLFNHQKDEEWIESQKNIFINLDKQVEGMYPEIWKSKDSIYKYLNGVFSSGRIIEKDDVVYTGILFNFIKNENYLIHFHIDELNNVNNSLYEYCFNNDNVGLLPHLTLRNAWKINNVNIDDVYNSLSKIGYKIKTNLTKKVDDEIKYTIVLPKNINLDIVKFKEHFSDSPSLNILYDKCNPNLNKIFIFYGELNPNLDNFNYRLCGTIDLAMEEINNHFRNDGKCKKDTPYEEKVKIFEDNVSFMLKNSTFIGQITKEKFNDIYQIIENKNLLVPSLPIFRYDDKVFCFGTGTINDDFEHGKYATLTTNEINQFLEKGYIIFLYTILDTKYNKNDKLKYRTVIFKES